MRRVARERGISESELTRQALAAAVLPSRPPGALSQSQAGSANRADELRNEGSGTD
jgi:hypothetical protein